jgi:hypothetical protein
MLKVNLVNFDDLTEEEKKYQPDNGNGKDCANYIKITHNGKTLDIMSDAVEPEDRTFARDFGDVIHAIELAYQKGLEDGKKLS